MNNLIEILILEDEEDLLELLEYQLQKVGYKTMGFLSCDGVEQFLEEEQPALMIVDRNLPNCEGSAFVSNLRSYGYNIPVIFLSAKTSEDEIYEGFENGCDDYITKPYKIKDVLFRIEAILRRVGVKYQDKIKHRDLILDTNSKILLINNIKIDLTNIEFKLLLTFIKNPNQNLDREFLKDEVWADAGDNFNDKTINVTLNRLKKKIDPKGEKEYFIPIWGVGYKLV
ncbi:Two-component system response regulator [hydrothermal vent metagenome]|uniref:Two-component system response regulator n=1 Tax=hydrothermal vent metagenome TaxID=652676 RepID=A0A1W1BAP6_9ZZZZ